jgi:anti-sigma-K factor RskA
MKPDERMEELAALYALGALEGGELREFEAALRGSAELQALVAGLGKSAEAVAGQIPAMEPPPQLRAKILAAIEPAQKVVTLSEPKFTLAGWWLRALTAGLAAVCLLVVVQDRQLRQTIEAQARQITAQGRRINDLNELAQSLQSATNNLQQTVLALRESNRLASLRITMLNSLIADAPKTVAVTLWDNHDKDGVFVVENLKALPGDRDYELWVLYQHKTPVAAGVFHMDASGTIRMEFHPRRSIQTAGQFCVTEEAKGGVDSPTLKNLVLASD